MTNLRQRLPQLLLAVVLLITAGACRPQVHTYTSAEVAIPDHLTNPEERRDYLVAHYWDRLQVWPDVPAEKLQRQTEDFCDLITGLPVRQVAPSLRAGLNALDDASLEHVLPIYKERLYQAGSPSYDEGLYAEVLRTLLSSDHIDSVTRSAAVLTLARLKHNAPGSIAQDFSYTRGDTIPERLHQLRAPHTLLLLVRDSSQQLQQWGRALSSQPSLQRLIRQRQLVPLVIATGLSRPDSLQRSFLPLETIWGIDATEQIRRERRYQLDEGTGLYLLDADKRILLRNGTIPQVHQILSPDEE